MRPTGSSKERIAILEQEFALLLSLISCDKSLRPSTRTKLERAYTLLFYTGCRASEITRLKVSDITNLERTYTLALDANTKTKKARTILFNYAMVCKILSLPLLDCAQHGGFLFYENAKSEPMSAKGFTALLNEYLAKYLGELYTTHSFRAGYVTRIVEASGNLKTAQDMVGHKSIKTTIRYLSTSKEQKLAALDKVFTAQPYNNSFCEVSKDSKQYATSARSGVREAVGQGSGNSLSEQGLCSCEKLKIRAWGAGSGNSHSQDGLRSSEKLGNEY